MNYFILIIFKCCDYVDAYYDFFSKGHQSMSELMPRVEKYREQIQQAKVQFQVQQEERKQNLDETGKIKVTNKIHKCII